MICALMQTTICLPTYNERENVERMVRSLHPLGVHVLVIDDNSPDGTGEIADHLSRELDGVSVLHRPRKEGLGPAYLAGFRQALDEGAELILEMDCGCSPRPRKRTWCWAPATCKAAVPRTGASSGGSSPGAARYMRRSCWERRC